ncbi:tetratricopeptide repeat protein [candidate division KSB1 bacterium]
MLLLTILSAMFASLDSDAQQRSTADQRLRLAQNLEQQGELESALTIFEELYTKQPENILFANNFSRILERLKKFDEWIGLLNDRIRRQPQYTNLKGELGRAHFLSGNEEHAYEIWEEIVTENPENPSSYQLVSSYLQRVRLYDESIEMLLRGREISGQKSLFSNQLANLYQVRRNYGDATREWLLWVEQGRQYVNMVENTINRYPAEPEIIAEVTAVLEEHTRNAEDNTDFLHLLAGYYIRNREYDKAFESSKTLDMRTKPPGDKIFEYADQIFKIGEYKYAVKAYEYFLETYPDDARVPTAHLGLARSLEGSGYLDSEMPEDSLMTAVKEQHRRRAEVEYKRITKSYKNRGVLMQAHYHLGVLYQNKFFDPDKAIAEYLAVRNISRSSRHTWLSSIAIGDCYLMKGDIKSAGDFFIQVRSADRAFDELKKEAEHKLLLNEYYKGNFEPLREQLSKLIVSTPLNSDLSNDLLALSVFLEENLSDDNPPLKNYASSEFLAIQRKKAQAAAVLDDLLDTSPDHPVADDALFLSAQLYGELQEHNKAITCYIKIQTDYPDSRFKEQAQIALGEIYENSLNDVSLAIKTYEDFLINYPESIHLDRIREKVRELK